MLRVTLDPRDLRDLWPIAVSRREGGKLAKIVIVHFLRFTANIFGILLSKRLENNASQMILQIFMGFLSCLNSDIDVTGVGA